jgi:hypothetical protein
MKRDEVRVEDVVVQHASDERYFVSQRPCLLLTEFIRPVLIEGGEQMKFVGARHEDRADEQSFRHRVFAGDRGRSRPSKGPDIDRLVTAVDGRVESAACVHRVADVSAASWSR